MKKFIVLISILSILSLANDYKNSNIEIPKESIRFRVIASSNKEEDQQLKLKVKENLEEELLSVLKDKNTLSSSRLAINSNLNLFKENIENTLKEENSNEKFTINYGDNYFPEKEYKNVIYKEGNYESLVVTLGEGEGENFWCVLFPPLCKLETTKDENIEYHVLVKDILEKYRKSK